MADGDLVTWRLSSRAGAANSAFSLGQQINAGCQHFARLNACVSLFLSRLKQRRQNNRRVQTISAAASGYRCISDIDA